MFVLKTDLPYLKDVIKISELVLSNKDFLTEVSTIGKFKDCELDGVGVTLLMKVSKPANVLSYRKLNPYSKTIAYTSGNNIYFNTRNNPRPIPEMVNTLVHEWLHVLGFKHVGNSAKGNENSVPYLVGDIAEKYVTKYLG